MRLYVELTDQLITRVRPGVAPFQFPNLFLTSRRLLLFSRRDGVGEDPRMFLD